MAPTLIASSLFDKNIGKFAHEGETCLLRFGYLITDDALYKLSQLELVDPEDEIHTYITIECVGAADDDKARITKTIAKMVDEDASDEEIIKHLLGSGYVDESKNVDAGRIALRSYFFTDDAGQEVEAPQVAGVKVERAFQQHGGGNHQRRRHNQRRQAVGQDFAKDDPALFFAAQFCGLDIVHHGDVHGDGTRQAEDAG